MKRILTILFVLVCLVSQAQLNPSGIVRIVNSSTTFGIPIPKGSNIVDMSTNKQYLVINPLDATATITSSLAAGIKEIWNNGNTTIGIGTTSITKNIGMIGTSAQTIGVEANTTSNTAGNNLTINAGNATSGSSDKNGGNLILQGGINTGTGTGGSILLQTASTGIYGSISSITLTFGGYSGYTNGGTYNISAGGSSGTVTVTASGGVVTGVTLVNHGTNYQVGSAALTGGSGAGATININSVTSSSYSSPATNMAISNGFVGVGYTSNPGIFLFGVNGTSKFNGAITGTTATFSSSINATNFILSSDRRLKQNIKPLFLDDNGIKFVNYTLIADKTNHKRIGVIAQDLEKIIPELVYTDEKGMKSVDYTGLLLAKIIELETRIKKLESDSKDLKFIESGKQELKSTKKRCCNAK